MTRPNRMNMDANSLLSNREFQEVLQEYFQNNTMTLDEFLENLPRFMMENYGINMNESDGEDEGGVLNVDYQVNEDEDEDLDLNDDDTFMAYLRQSSGFRAQAIDTTSDLLLRSLLTGRREIPLRNILPRSPPPSPVPNIVNTAASIPFFQRNRQLPPQVPSRPGNLRRVPSQLRRSTTTQLNRNFDPNYSEDCKSPNIYNNEASPVDRNNMDENLMPIMNEYLNRYGHSSIVNFPRTESEESPER